MKVVCEESFRLITSFLERYNGVSTDRMTLAASSEDHNESFRATRTYANAKIWQTVANGYLP